MRCGATASATALEARGTVVPLDIVVTDAVDPDPPTLQLTRSDGAAADAVYPVGHTTVQVVAVDAAGNRTEPCTIDVDVRRALSHYGWACATAGEGTREGDPLGWVAAALALGFFARKRRSTLAPLLSVALLLVATSASAAAETKRLKLAFTGVPAGPGVSKDAAKTIEDSLESELNAVGLYQVISPNFIATLLGKERQRQLLGCPEDESTTSCMAELAGALDGDRIVSSDLSRVGDSWVLNASLVDGRKAKQLNRVGRTVKGSSLEPLLDELRPLVYELVNVEPALAGKPLRVDRRFGGLVLALRGDSDLLAPTLGAIPSLSIEFSGRRFGGALVLLGQARPGARLEARYYPITLGAVRPYLGAGATGFPTGIAARAAAGVAMKFDRLQLFGDVGYERFLVQLASDDVYQPNALVFGLGVGWGL
jgi:MYXO-CTERM domain-containing protein